MYALQKHRPLTLHATIELPRPEDDPTISIAGFIYLVKLYRPFDDTFVGLWNKTRMDCSTEWLAQLQRQLTQALPPYINVTESQAADLRTSQQWLRTMVWQLSVKRGYLSSTTSESSMTFGYPIEIARDLVAVIGKFSQQSMEVHGIGLVSMKITCYGTHVLTGGIDREDFRHCMQPHRRNVMRPYRVETLRDGPTRLPQPASSHHLNPSWRGVSLPPASDSQDRRISPSNGLPDSVLTAEEIEQIRGRSEAGVLLQLTKFEPVTKS